MIFGRQGLAGLAESPNSDPFWSFAIIHTEFLLPSTLLKPLSSPSVGEPDFHGALRLSRVWVVEDSPMQLERSRALLATRYAVEGFSSGEVLLERLALGNPPDLIIMDWELPGLSGPEVCRFLREGHDEASLPVLLLTSKGASSDLAHGLESGANDYVVKPFNDGELLARVRTLVRVQQQAEVHRRREAWLATTLTSIADAVITTDGKGLVNFLNPTAQRLTGWSQEAARGRPMSDIFRILDSASRQPLTHPVARVLQDHRPVPVTNHTLLVARDGSEAPIEESAAPIVGERGELQGVVLVFRDVSERRRAEAERATLLARAEEARAEAQLEREKLQALLMTAPVAIAILEGPAHTFGFANALYRKLLGGCDVAGKALLHAQPELAGQGIEVLLQRVMTTGEPLTLSAMPVTLGAEPGEEGFLNVTYAPKRNVRGQVDGVLVAGVDVTEQVRTQQRAGTLAEKVKASEAELRLVIDALPVLVAFVTAGERYGLVNKAYEDWFGRPQAELLGQTVRESIGEDAYAQFGPLVQRGLAGEQFSVEQYAVPYRQGGVRDVKISILPHRDTLEQVDGYVALLEDITARRRLEQELKQNAAFEQQLIGIVSHDLRNPLNVINLATHLLTMHKGLPADLGRLVQRIQSASGRAIRLVRDLLDFTQARLGGGIPIQREAMDLHGVTRQMLDEVGAAHPARQVVARCEGDGRGEWDADRLGQVVQNLVTNALKYSPEGSVVSVVTRGDGGDVTLAVRNEGKPIDAGALQTLFTPLQRGMDETDGTGRSIGLGLYIVSQVVAAHGGTIAVVSTAADGTTFTVRLPRAGGAPAPAPAA